MNGTDSYLDKAEIGDYVVISMGADSKATIDEIPVSYTHLDVYKRQI